MIKKLSIVIILCLLLSACGSEKISDIQVNEDIDSIDFEDVWSQMEMNLGTKIYDNLSIEVDSDYKVSEIKFSVIEEINGSFELKWVKVLPKTNKIEIRKTSQVKGFKDKNIDGSYLMRILNDIELSKYIKQSDTDSSFFTIDYLKVTQENYIIEENRKTGDYIGKDKNTKTGEVFKNYYNNKHIIFENGKERILSYGEKYKFNSDVAKIIIFSMKKMDENSFRGSVEWSIYYPIHN